MLELREVCTYYGNIQALRDISLRVEEGEIITLIGANGAGKSTTLMSISGIVPPKRGEILFRGRPIHELSADRIVALGICQVPEGRHIFPDLTVAENLDMGAFLRRDRKGIARDLDYVYSLFPILRERRNQPGGNLSGGEQQMLAIARALMINPRLLILDEATEGLAPLIRDEIWGVIDSLKQRGQSILIVDKNLTRLLSLSDRYYLMEKGRIVSTGSAETLLCERELQARYLGI